MTDQTKFEEMLEKLVNEDRDGAEALFHEIVVEKSREIYQNILDEADEEVEETTDEEVDEATDEEVDESEDDDLDEATDEEVDESEDDDLDEMFGLDEPEMEADPAMDMIGDIEGGDEGDMDMDDEGDDDEEAEGPEEAMADLEDALEALKAEFEKMMGDEEPGDEEPGDEEPEEEAMAFEADDEEVEESKEAKTASEQMREYVEKITPKMGDTGTNGTKSAVAGKNDMGGTSANIAQGSADEKGGTGAAAPKEDSAGNVNTPGGKASKSMKSQSPAKAGEAANKKPVMGG